ncbi:MAG TPA: trypsin-like peptidase domain-containing protein, partial [Planctomycetota bacterium]|nr:trypsin-like peptidase domain-containing protein [Planctomycetota bacterium]
KTKALASAPAPELAAKIVRDGAPSVVSVWAGTDESRPKQSAPKDPYAEKPEKGLGSGVIVDPAGLVLTSSSVVREAQEVGVLLLDGRSFRAKVLHALPGSHAALLQLALPAGVKVPAVELGSSDAALAGETIAVIGNPYGRTPTVSIGVLSALEVEERLRLGAWVHDGHKGGAVLDATGRLIGLPAADIFEGRERERGESYLGVALPIDRLRTALAKEFEEHGTAKSLREPAKASEKELALRRDQVTGIVDGTRDSLVNVEIMAEKSGSGGFDPFGTPGEMRLFAQGSGVIIDASGLAITNWHVVHPTLAEDGTQRSDHAVEVTLPSKKRYTAHVLATSRDDDLALIRLQLAEGDAVHPVPLGSSKDLRRGDVVVAIGNPYGKANTVTVGIVAAKDQDAHIAGRLTVYKDMLQTDAAINPGNSGGALLDLEGRLVGINSAGRSGVGLAIPVERVREVFGQKLMSTMGPYLGMIVEDAPEAGVSIRSVDEHSPAANAGVTVGDRLLSLDGHALKSAMEFGNTLLALQSASAMRVELERNGARVTAEIHPVSQAVWRLFRQTGIEVEEVDYGAAAETIREASIALHRAYTGLDGSEPSRVMSGALRVVQAVPRDGHALEVKVGDMLLGGTAVTRTLDGDHARLVRFEDVVTLRDFVEPLATKQGDDAECWIMRDGKVMAVRVTAVKVK